MVAEFQKFVRRMRAKFGEDLLDPIDAVKLKSFFEKVYLDQKYRSGNCHNRFASLPMEAFLQFLVGEYGIDVNDLLKYDKINDSYHHNRDFVEDAYRMVAVYRRMSEDEPLEKK